MIMAALRVLAFAIAIVAVFDPQVTTSRSSRPPVSLLATDSVRNAELANRVEREIARQFTVIRAAHPSAAGTVLVGDEVPEAEVAGPLIVVTPAHDVPFVRILALDVPAPSAWNSSVPIKVTLQLKGARNRHVDLRLRMGNVSAADQLLPMDSDTVEVTATFDRVPSTVGPVLLHVRATIAGTNASDEASTTIDARETRLPVLFFDPRASWLSTFVRRAAERDARFAVTHRVITSRGISNSSGAAPVSLRDATLLSAFGTIVAGSPELLSDADVSALEAFMRERGGRVLLLMDGRAAGPIDRLTGVSSWRTARLASDTSLESEPPVAPAISLRTLRTQEIAWPSRMPEGATIREVNASRDSVRRPVVWSIPVGAGRLVVSGALDAWRYRDDGSGFDNYWTSTIAELASDAPSAIEIDLTSRAMAPGQSTHLTVWVRSAALSNVADSPVPVSATLAGPGDTARVRLWPTATPGTFAGTIVAPRAPGVYRITASSGADSSDVALVVDSAARVPARDERHLLDAIASSRNGRLVPETELGSLSRVLQSAVESTSRVETWYPMRSAWWILPFALLLGGEWWGRRRRGLA